MKAARTPCIDIHFVHQGDGQPGLLKCKHPGKEVGKTESLMGERGSKQYLETAGRERQLLSLDASTRALGQACDPSGLILAIRVTWQCINRAVMQ